MHELIQLGEGLEEALETGKRLVVRETTVQFAGAHARGGAW
jgi:hypothetical protein